jgi:hypothetical protein
MTAQRRPQRRPLTHRQRVITLSVLGAVAGLFVLAVVVGAIQRGNGSSTAGATTQQQAAPASGSSAMKQLSAEMYVTSQNYEQHVGAGDSVRAAADLQTLRGDCDTARTLGLSTDQSSTAIRGFCATIGDAVP